MEVLVRIMPETLKLPRGLSGERFKEKLHLTIKH